MNTQKNQNVTDTYFNVEYVYVFYGCIASFTVNKKYISIFAIELQKNTNSSSHLEALVNMTWDNMKFIKYSCFHLFFIHYFDLITENIGR